MRNAKEKFIDNLLNLYPSLETEHFSESGDLSFIEFVQKLRTPSMFGGERLFFISNAENKKVLADKKNFEAFEKNFSFLADEIFVYVELSDETSVDLAKKLKEFCQKHEGDFFEYKAIREYEIPEMIISSVAEKYGRSISKETAELLVSQAGADLGILDGELRKIDAALHSKKVITRDAIFELTGDNRQHLSESITQFIAERRWNKEAVSIFDEFAGRDNQFAIPFLSELYRKFWLLLKIRLYSEENSSKINPYFKSNDYRTKSKIAFETALACKILKENEERAVYPRVIKPRLIEQASLFGKSDLFEIIKEISRHDRDIKSGEIKSDLQKCTIKDLCRKIVRAGRQ
jgi:DNA polymerase III delta subunit